MLPSVLKRLRYEIRTHVATQERIYMKLTALKRNDGKGLTPVDVRTELTLEAFPRSGNTFAYEAFSRAQPRPVRVAHHSHAPAQIMRSIRLGVPILVIVRQPQDAVLSLVIREPVIRLRQGIRAWLRFYDALRPFHKEFVVATFDQVRSDFGAVIRRVNERFCTSFVPFDHSAKNVAACFEAIQSRNALKFGNGQTQEHMVARPSSQRAAVKASLEPKFVEHQVLLARANAVYKEFAQWADANNAAF